MLIKDVKTGMQVLISPWGTTAKTVTPYKSRVELVEEDKYVLIHAVYEKGSRVTFRGAYKLNFISGTSQYVFSARFLSDIRMERFILLRFEIQDAGEKIQRRNAFRFACAIPFSFNVVADNGEQSEPMQGVIRDLSGGGIKINTTANIAEGALLRIDLHLDEEYLMPFGVIRMKKHTPENIKFPYTYGISFEAFPEKEEERIMRYVSREQLKNLRKPQRSIY